MADAVELRERLSFRKAALSELRKAYLELVGGGVKSYTISDRTLTRLDLPSLKKEIKAAEDEVDALENLLNGQRPRRAFGITPRDW